VLGAAILVALPEIFRDFQSYRMLVFGLMLMVLMVARPQGLLVVRSRNAGSTPEPTAESTGTPPRVATS